jgi:predicted RNA-binding protein YlqC (UPF0109 family)
MGNRDQEFLESVVREMVEFPEKVSTERIVDERGVLIKLKMDENDIRHVIGKQGQTANALRMIMRTVGARQKSRISLHIEEPAGRVRPPRIISEQPMRDPLDESFT